MDPQVVLTRLLAAYLDNDEAEWTEAARVYNRWRERGGFPATFYSVMSVDRAERFGLIRLVPESLGELGRVVAISTQGKGKGE